MKICTLRCLKYEKNGATRGQEKGNQMHDEAKHCRKRSYFLYYKIGLWHKNNLVENKKKKPTSSNLLIDYKMHLYFRNENI